MQIFSSPGYSVTIEVNVSANAAFEYLREPLNLGKWALGCWDTQATDEPGLYKGTSLFDQQTTFFKFQINEELGLIDSHLGDKDALKPRISIRVIAGEVYGNLPTFCLVTIDAWRDAGMDDARWRQLCMCHETEILLVKALIERKA